jgi:chitinase
MPVYKGRKIVKSALIRWCLFLSISLLPGVLFAAPWVTGYLPGYTQTGAGEADYMQAADWEVLTHVVHFSATLNADGSLNDNANQVSAIKRAKAIELAHANNKPILFSVNAWEDVHKAVLSDPVKRQTLIDQLIARLDEGYDGLDIDLEPIVSWGATDNADYETFINDLHAAMQSKSTPLLSKPLLAVAADVRAKHVLSRLHHKFDQINMMFYNMATHWEEITWHDAALYHGGRTYPSTGGVMSSVDGYIKELIAAGVPREKLGVGLSFEIRIWEGGAGTSTGGATAPQQTWTSAPKEWTTGTPLESYAQLMDNRYQPEYYRWDEIARMSYLSIDNDGAENDQFISFNDPRTVAEKVQYTKKMQLGGLMIWHLQLDYRASKTGNKRRALMHAIRNSLAAGE